MGKKTAYVCIVLLIISLAACAAQQTAPSKVFSEDERIVELYVPGCV